MDDRKIMAGQTTSQPAETPVQNAARKAAEKHFGGLDAYSANGSAFRRGFEHYTIPGKDFRGECENYDAGWRAADLYFAGEFPIAK